MKFQLPFVPRSRHERALAAEQAETLRVKKVKDEWWQRHDAVAEELVATRIVNDCLTEELATIRAKLAASMDAESALAQQIHEMAQPVEPTDAELDDIARLIRERDSERRRADQLQKQYDNAVGLGGRRPEDSRRWQPGYKAPEKAS